MTIYSEHQDLELMALIREDDQQAFAELHSRYKGVLFVHALRMLDDEDEAQDVVQELFVTLWTRRSEIILHSGLSSYLYSAVRNRVLDLIAKKKTEEKYIRSLAQFIAEGENVTDHAIRQKELAVIIEREVALLPDRMKEIFQLSRNENRSYKEIADELNISDKTVKKQVSNALTILRKKLEVVMTLFLSL